MARKITRNTEQLACANKARSPSQTQSGACMHARTQGRTHSRFCAARVGAYSGRNRRNRQETYTQRK
eukprot:4643745-Alexandrium_andersonii.AAC.1